jgi:hypothetical protein
MIPTSKTQQLSDRPFLSLDNLPTYKALQKAVTFSHRQGDRGALFFEFKAEHKQFREISS